MWVIQHLYTLWIKLPCYASNHCHHANLLRYYWLYSYSVHYIPVTCLFYKPEVCTPLIIFTCFTQPSSPCLLVTTTLFSASMSLFLFLSSTYIRSYGICLSLCLTYFTSCMRPSRTIHVVTNGNIPFSVLWVIFHCIDIWVIYQWSCIYIIALPAHL